MITVRKIEDAATREQALKVVEGVYWQEKNWIRSVEEEIPTGIASDPQDIMVFGLSPRPPGRGAAALL